MWLLFVCSPITPRRNFRFRRFKIRFKWVFFNSIIFCLYFWKWWIKYSRQTVFLVWNSRFFIFTIADLIWRSKYFFPDSLVGWYFTLLYIMNLKLAFINPISRIQNDWINISFHFEIVQQISIQKWEIRRQTNNLLFGTHVKL